MPERGRHLRVIIAELGRIASHLVGMGAYGLDLGTFSPFLYAFREREKILDLFEEACGARLTYSYLTPGGATADLPRGWLQKCEQFLDQFEPIIQEYHTLLTTNAIFVKRTAGIGILSPEMAIDFGTQRPGAARQRRRPRPAPRRRRDLHVDVRGLRVRSRCARRNGHYPRDHDYPPVPHEAVLGDCWHRFYVRMLEVVQSVDLCRQAIDRYSTSTGSYGEPIKLDAKAAQGRMLSRNRVPQGPDGLLHRRRAAKRFPGGRGPAAAASATCRSRTRCAKAASSPTCRRSSDRSTS